MHSMRLIVWLTPARSRLNRPQICKFSYFFQRAASNWWARCRFNPWMNLTHGHFWGPALRQAAADCCRIRNLVSWFSGKSLKLLPDVKAEIQQIRFRLGLFSMQSPLGSLQCSPRHHSWIYEGLLLKGGRRGEGKGREVMGWEGR